MLASVPIEICDSLESFYSAEGNSRELISFTPVVGGSINKTGKICTNQGDIFIKWNEKHRYPGMLSSEAKGLLLLARANALYVPAVITTAETETQQYLILEYVQPHEKKKSYWDDLARGLVILHQCTASSYGLDYGNYIGSLQQSNRQCTSWVEFFIRQRLEPQLRMARNRGLIPTNLVSDLHRLYNKLEERLPEEAPSLLHGDFWNGNLMTNYRGEPCLIDPAVYYGHREMDIAMTKLFGGFDREFYSQYNSYFPMISGWEERIKIYNLYPLLVHLNLFGSTYLLQIKTILKKVV